MKPMPALLPLTAQTIYAELLDLCSAAQFDADFPPTGTFVSVKVKDRRYWYYQTSTKDRKGRQHKRYVGPDNEQTAKLIERHGLIKSSYKERRAIVVALRAFGLSGPLDETGKIVRGLADHGVFRLRACVIGTIAYQTYQSILGVKLPVPTMQTNDLDLAQSHAISVAVAADEQTPPMLDILHGIDASFRAVPTLHPGMAVSYINDRNYRVEILTDNRGPNRDTPIALPALQTHAQPMRYLDYLLYSSIPAVVLYNGGVLVNVPQPARYAVHKLIVSQVRTETSTKRSKDLFQASALFDAIAERRSFELADAWAEAYDRGPRWRKPLRDALAQLNWVGRDRLLYATQQTRSIVPNLDVEFRDAAPRYDFVRDAVLFSGLAFGEAIDFAISRAALEDWFGAEGTGAEARIKAFREHRVEIQAMAREVYLNDPVPADGTVLITTSEVLRLREKLESRSPRRSGVVSPKP
jgi:hypothetical protein